MYSNYVLAGVSVERCIAICSPFLARRLLRKRGPIVYLALTLICTTIYYSYSFYFYGWMDTEIKGVPARKCDLRAYMNPDFAIEVRPFFEFVMNSIIPATLIVVCNVLIICTLAGSKEQLQKKDDGKGGGGDKDKQIRAMIGMLLTVTFAFVILTTPVRVVFLLQRLFTHEYWQRATTRIASNR